MKIEDRRGSCCKLFAGMTVFSVIFMFAGLAMGGAIDLPHKYPRSNPNLLSNPTFDGSTGWVLNSGPTYQSTGGHTDDGSGCIRFPAGEDTYCQVISEYIYYPDFEYNVPYTISFYMKTQHEPVYLKVCLHMYDANNNRTFSTSGRAVTSTTGEWQEAVCVVNITDLNVVKVKVVIEETTSAAYTSDFFIDDVYFGQGLSFAEAPVTSRQTFGGSKVSIDELGNWRTHESNVTGGEWTDFFPFALYPDLAFRTDFQSLSAQGFNVVMSQQFKSRIQWAKNAVSTFNPNGMKSGLRLSTYATPGQQYWTLSLLAGTILDVNSDLSETLLCYDWDNENNQAAWSLWFDMLDTIRGNDSNHPVYILNGNSGAQRLFSKRLSDVCGTYTGTVGAEMESGVGSFNIMQYLEKQDIPVSIGQINSVENVTYGFRLRLYYCLINGAKGICWWGDGRDSNANSDINYLAETRAWWNDIPNLRNEIDQMMPILKQPHWTSWTATCSSSAICFGMRNYQNEGYMILMNPEDTQVTATFTLNGYSAGGVWNYFDNSFVASVENNQFTVVLPAKSTAVYWLEPEFILNGGMETAGSPVATWSHAQVGAYERDTVNKYSGDASAKIYNSGTDMNSCYLQYFQALKPSTSYRFSLMMKTDNVVKDDPNSSYHGAIAEVYAGGTHPFSPFPGRSGSNDWQLIETTLTTPAVPNTTWYVRLRLWNASGTVWFDNASLREVF